MLKFFVAVQSYAANAVHELRNSEDGQTMAEYGVVLAVVAVGIIVALGLLSGAISDALTAVTGIIDGSDRTP